MWKRSVEMDEDEELQEGGGAWNEEKSKMHYIHMHKKPACGLVDVKCQPQQTSGVRHKDI